MNKALLVVVSCFFVGCGPPSEEEIASDYQEDPVVDTGVEVGLDLVVDNGHLKGSLERFTDLDEDATRLSGRSDSSQAQLDVVVENPDAAGMVRITFNNGGLDHNDLVAGYINEFEKDEYSNTELTISAIGCTGSAYLQWDYDRPADTLLVEVSDGPDDSRIINFVASWLIQDDEVLGRFTIR